MRQISSLVAAAEGPVAEFSGFINFKEKKRKSNLLMSFPKIVNQMGSFGEKRKNIFFPLLSAGSRYFKFSLLSVRECVSRGVGQFRRHSKNYSLHRQTCKQHSNDSQFYFTLLVIFV